MRLASTTLLLFSLSILLSPTSAQTPTSTPSPRNKNDTVPGDLDSMLTCMKCLSKAGLSQVSACSNLRDNPAISSVPVDKLNETQRQCYCGLVSSTEWTNSCSTAPKQLCNTTLVDTFLQGFAHVKQHVCTATSPGQKSSAVGGRGRVQAVVVEVSVWMTLSTLAVLTALI